MLEAASDLSFERDEARGGSGGSRRIELGVGVLEVVLIGLSVALAAQWLKRGALFGFSPMLLLMTVFLAIGISSVAGGLAMIPMLDHDVVAKLHWLTPREFTDAITLGQLTPGPVAIAGTFIGFRVAGLAGALVATIATFAPPFIANVAAGRSLEAFRGSRVTATLLAALGPLTVGIVAASALSVGRAAIVDWAGGTMAAVAFVALTFLRLPPLAALVLCAAARVILF